MGHVLLPGCEEIGVELSEGKMVEKLAVEAFNRGFTLSCSRRL